MLLILVLSIPSAFATTGFHTCTGKVLDFVTRANNEDTEVRIENMNGAARLNFGTEEHQNRRDRQFAMLLAAYAGSYSVTLEFLDNSLSCTDDHRGLPIRFVRRNPL